MSLYVQISESTGNCTETVPEALYFIGPVVLLQQNNNIVFPNGFWWFGLSGVTLPYISHISSKALM